MGVEEIEQEVGGVKVKVWAHTGMVGSRVEDEIEVEDDATDEAIECAWAEWIWTVVDGGWKKN